LDRQNRDLAGVTIYLSVDGVGALPVEPLRAVMQGGGKVAIAFDADKPGELMAWRVAHQLRSVDRLLPTAGKDWNEQLIGVKQVVADRQQRLLLWQWHSAALMNGRSEKYLNRIRAVAVACVKGESLTEPAKQAMQQDLHQSQCSHPHTIMTIKANSTEMSSQ
jgi:DNA primase